MLSLGRHVALCVEYRHTLISISPFFQAEDRLPVTVSLRSLPVEATPRGHQGQPTAEA